MAEPCIPVRINRLCCRICNGVLRDPVTVLCGHNFCMQCIQEWWDKDDNINYNCPECGQKFPSRPQLIKNTTLAELVKDTQKGDSGAGKRKLQTTGSPLKRPRSCEETSAPGSSLCVRHNSSLEVYCCTDELVICPMCALTEHQGHSIGYVEMERRTKQEELKKLQTNFKQILQQQKNKWENMGNMFKQIQVEARQTKDYCEGVVVSLIDSLQKHYLSVRELIGAQEEVVTVRVQSTLHTLEVKMEEMKKREAELDCLLQTESDVQFLKEWASLQLLFQSGHLHPADGVLEDLFVPFQVIKKNTEQLGRQLEEICSKRFASVIQSDLSEVQIAPAELIMEPKTRDQFLQYACELTLDRATAHQDLCVSEGDKVVRMSPQPCKPPHNRSPERFIHRRQVLCREGLQAERCYYEIEVEGNKVEIALTYNRIDRKTFNNQSAFGANTNSWSLDRSTKYSVSHNNNSIELTTSPSHHRIGVYLKFKEGTLSFYEVSDSMKFLYKVEAKFTESLYPGFWLGEKCCIRICDLRQTLSNSL